MSLASRQFKNNKTGEIVRVIDSFEDIAILENKQKIRASALSDINQYTELIDPANFFSNQGAYNALADKIKNIPTHMITEEDGSSQVNLDSFGDQNDFTPSISESAIVMSTEEDEMAELAKKYGASIDTQNSLQKQNEAFAKILGDDSDELPQVQNIQRVEASIQSVSMPVKNESQRPVPVEDPIITMFRKTKRNVEFKISVDISDKIPRLDFIEMMEDSYEISMIDFLADEFTNKILQDHSQIRETIKSKIKQLVYGGEFKSLVNDQITDSVTQSGKHEPLSIEKEPVLTKDLETPTKQKTIRKPRAKKETSK